VEREDEEALGRLGLDEVEDLGVDLELGELDMGIAELALPRGISCLF
jgi:hypothetical protein